jgi:hypothetical protein
MPEVEPQRTAEAERRQLPDAPQWHEESCKNL